MKKILVLGMVLTLMLGLSIVTVIAGKPGLTIPYEVIPSGGRATVFIPEDAVQVTHNVFSLGVAVHKGRIVEGYAIIDYREGFVKPGTECGNGICEPGENARKCPVDCGGGEEPDTSSCYGFLARGAKWKEVEDYIVDPTNTRGLNGAFVRNNIAYDISKWEAAAGKNILGNEVSGIVDGADTVSPDDKNEVYFGDIEGTNAIGVTIIWGIFGGPPKQRELVEWDQVYDQVDFDWSEDCLSENCTITGSMDFENIATHELGHSVGLDDLYEPRCSEQTMYGYADYGETKGRTLEAGDIKGIQELYA